MKTLIYLIGCLLLYKEFMLCKYMFTYVENVEAFSL